VIENKGLFIMNLNVSKKNAAGSTTVLCPFRPIISTGIVVLSILLFNVDSSKASVIFSTDFSSNPASDFTSYNNTTVFDWDSANQRLHADRGSSTPYLGFYQLTNPAAVAMSNVVLQTAVNVTVGTPNLKYAVIGGLQARTTPGATTFANGYYAVLGQSSWSKTDKSLHLYLGRDMGAVVDEVDMGTILSTGTYAASGDTDYQLRFSLSGTSLVAQLWDASGTTKLEEISATDGTYSEGNAGYVSALRSATTHYYYDDFSVDAIPEPAVLGLICLMGVSMLAAKRIFKA
jgi:hypothetical protein